MLENIREGVGKPWVKVVIFAIIISFVFAGYFSSSLFLGDPSAVAIVNGESISRNEFQRAYVNTKSQRADFYKANVKTEEDERNFQESVLQQMITEKVRELAIFDMGLRLSDKALREVIQSNPNFQVDGKYSTEQLNRVLSGIQMSRDELKNAFQTQETTQYLVNALISTEFALEQETMADYELMTQKRTGRALQVNTAPFKNNVTVSDTDISTHYEENKELFRVEEKVSLEYIELSVEKLTAKQLITEGQITRYYDENLQAYYKEEDERHFSHILVSSSDDSGLQKIKELKARIDAGEDFAEIAKLESDDVPTREVGGDLGVLKPDDMEPSFGEAAATLLNAGDVSEPVKTEYGYQLIKLTAFVKGAVKPLETVKEDIVATLKRKSAEKAFRMKSQDLERLAFEVSDTLKDVSVATGLEIQESPLIGRSFNEGIFANQAVKDAAFSVDVKEGLVNSAPVEIAENHLIVLRIKEHKPSQIQPLNAVEQTLINQLKEQKAKEKAKEVADEIIARLEAKKSTDDLVDMHSLKWVELTKVERNNASLSYFANQKLFQMKAPAKNKITLDHANDFQGITILLLSGVDKGDWNLADEATKKQRRNYSSSYYGSASYGAFIENLRNVASVTRNLSNLPK